MTKHPKTAAERLKDRVFLSDFRRAAEKRVAAKLRKKKALIAKAPTP